MATILNYFSGMDNAKDIPKSSNSGVLLCRSGMALSTRQMYDMVMQGRSNTAIVDQPQTSKYDVDESFGPDERELASVHEYIQNEKHRVENNLKELVDTGQAAEIVNSQTAKSDSV